jgi:hypothetical protein
MADSAALGPLAATLQTLSAALDAPDAPAQVDALESAVAAALGAARAAEAKGSARRPIDSTKLLLRWRGAQSQVSANIVRLGAAVLAREDVQNDPRLNEVEAAVAELPGLVPKFGPELGDLLDKAMNAGSAANVAQDALKLIAGYRQSLAGAKSLLAFEQLAATDLGGDTALVSSLDGALGELEQELRAAA